MNFKKTVLFQSAISIVSVRLLTVIIAAMLGAQAWAQAPALLWSTNVGALVFAIDVQTNVYAYNGGNVVVLNSAGGLVSSNLVCPAPSTVAAGRDAAGNLYFTGTYSGTQSFGGMSLTNNSGNPFAFTAKYTSAGALVWVYSYSPGAPYILNGVGNIQVDPSGVAYVAFNDGWNNYNDSDGDDVTIIGRYDTNGSFSTPLGIELNNGSDTAHIGVGRVGAVSPASAAAIDYLYNGGYYANLETVGIWNTNINQTFYPARAYALSYPPPTGGAMPIGNAQGEIMTIQGSNLVKQNSSGTVILNTNIGTWMTLAPDLGGGLHAANEVGQIARYDYNGNRVWTISLNSNCKAMVVDSPGNRFFSLNNGTVARLAADYYAPSVTNAPQSQKIFSGSNVVFNVGTAGSTPYSYYWWFNGQPLASQTNATLSLHGVAPANAGQYSVIISNFVGSITSAPAMLQVKSVELFAGGQMLANGAYYFPSPPTLSVHSAFTNGQSFYTLDGSTPDFTSAPYSGPFTISNNATVNAIGYSADFSQSEYADTVNATVPPQYTLTTTTAGGGTVSLNPAGGAYASNTLVTATANPAAGYSFLYWQGAVTGAGSTAYIGMNQNQSLTAVFGTTLSTTVAGNGQVLLAPGSGLYPYGTVVRLEALPQAGNYFGLWGNAASGSANPLYFTVTNPTPTVSSLFGAVTANKSALTLLILGQGKVSASPAGNLFTNTQSVTITATPGSGQSFLNWSGDASGSQNPLAVSMSQSRVITAHFSGQSVALLSAGSAFTPQGFQFVVGGDPMAVYHILSSTDLINWQDAGMVTNGSGQTAFTDPATNSPVKYYRAVLTQ